MGAMEESTERRKARILIVDDDVAIHRVIEKILTVSRTATDAGDADRDAPPSSKTYALSFASNGQEAVTLAERAQRQGTPFKVALVDVRMPGWDGIKTLRAFRSHPALCDVRTMMLTADASQGTVMAAIQGGAHDYVVKSSFSHEDFCRKLGRLLPDAADASAGGERSVPVGGRRPGTSRILERVPLPASAEAAGGDAAHERLQQIIDAWE